MKSALTAYEMDLVTDAEILLTKNKIIKKVIEEFEGLSAFYIQNIQGWADSLTICPKISRGENYLGLPYVILDYPRQFGKEDTFAIRSFFWWGNFFSITLQLSGKYLSMHNERISSAIKNSKFKDWYISNSTEQWQHHFEEGNYSPVEFNKDYNIKELPFIKLAKKIPLNKWDVMEEFFTNNFMLLTEVLNY